MLENEFARASPSGRLLAQAVAATGSWRAQLLATLEAALDCDSPVSFIAVAAAAAGSLPAIWPSALLSARAFSFPSGSALAQPSTSCGSLFAQLLTMLESTLL